jgi:3-hydroxyacyl-[acyl-carrier-protein] dehydratase
MRTLREEIMACAEGQVRILEANQGCELTFRPSDGFTGFRGHFPGHPILPAFVQLLMAECAVRMHSTCPWSLRRIERGKFLKPIGPNEPVTVCWQEQRRDEGLRCSFTLRVGAERAAVFALEFAAEEGQHA